MLAITVLVLLALLGGVFLWRWIATSSREARELEAELADDDFDPPLASPGVWARDMKPRG